MELKIVTPDKLTFQGKIDQVIYKAPHGEIGILPGHAPFFSLINPGVLVIDENGKKRELAVGSGFVEVLGEQVIILTDMALSPEEGNDTKAKEAIARAQELLKNTTITDEEKDKHLEIIEKSLAILRIRQKNY